MSVAAAERSASSSAADEPSAEPSTASADEPAAQPGVAAADESAASFAVDASATDSDLRGYKLKLRTGCLG